jgi:hypothetical protein
MKKLCIALASLPLLAAGAALAQTTVTPEDEDGLTPRERILARHPNLHPEWTWMSENQAVLVLNAAGYSDVLLLERYGAFWRGKAIKEGGSYHVAVNRYMDVIAHMDRKSLVAAAERKERAKPASQTMLATLNGPVAVPVAQAAPTAIRVGRPVATVMGGVGWTWMQEDQAVKILQNKGYTNVSSLRRDPQGIWRAKAIKDDVALRVAIDFYGNLETQPQNLGGLAQASPSD